VDEIEHLEIMREEKKGGTVLSETLPKKYYFKMQNEPIFDSILLNMVLGNSVNLKKKARIKVKNSAVLMGIIDERGILEEGEIFVRIQRQSFAIDENLEEFCSESTDKTKYE
jgi:hypothetical protein